MHKRTWLLIAGAVATLALGALTLAGNGALPVPGIASDRHASNLPTATPGAYRLVEAAKAQVGVTTSYDSSYVELDYPDGDVPIPS